MLKVAKLDRYDMLNTPKSDGSAFTIWFSGCHYNCKGCQNPELLDGSVGENFTVDELFSIIRMETDKLKIGNVVFLGGEPLDQDPEDLYNLAERLHGLGYRIWLYTGCEFEDLPEEFIRFFDTIKCGTYKEDLRVEGKFPITSNQRVFRNYAGDWRLIDL